MTQPVWVKALHPSISDGVDVFPPRSTLEFPNAIVTDVPLEDKIIIEITGGGAVGGDLSGTVDNAVVEKVKGTTIGTGGGALATGKVLRVTGLSSADWGAVDLADTDAVTGILPAGNQAAQTLGGDLSGTTTSASVINVTGDSGFVDIASTGAILRVAEGATTPGITHTGKSADGSAPQDYTITPQAAYSGATGANRVPGSFIVQLSDPTNSGTTYPKFLVNQGAVELARFDNTSGGATSRFWLSGEIAATNSPGGYLTWGDASTQAAVQVASTNEVFIVSGNYVIVRSNATGMYFDGTPIRFRDASFGLTMYFELNAISATNQRIVEAATFTLTQDARTVDAATHDLTIEAQSAYASSTGSNRKPGDAIILVGSPTNGGTTYASFNLKRGSTIYASIDSQYGIVTAGETTTNYYAAIGPLLSAGSANSALWLLPGGVAPTTGNVAMYADSTVTWINGRTASYKIQMSCAGSAYFTQWDSANGVHRTKLNQHRWDASCTQPMLIHDQATSGNGVDSYWYAQDSESSGDSNGGSIHLIGGANNNAGFFGGVKLYCGAALVEVTCVVTDQRIVALCGADPLVAAQMPDGTGDRVAYFAECAVAPDLIALPTDGGVLWVEDGALNYLSPGGTFTGIAPNDLRGFKDTSGKGHCPKCGTDFAVEWENRRWGKALTVCMWCLTEEIGEREFIVRKVAA